MESVRTAHGRDVRQLVDEHIRAAAAAGAGRVPAERQIAEEIGCTRAQVRRVLAELERAGRISREVGRGTFLTAAPEQHGHRHGTGFAPAAIMTTCLLFEPEVVSLAALAATDQDFAELQRCLQLGESATDYQSFEQWDISLHHAFAVATHNRQILAMVDVLNSTRNNPVWGRLKQDGFTPQNRAVIERDHHEIVAALMERDRRRAAVGMTTHLRFIRQMVSGEVK